MININFHFPTCKQKILFHGQIWCYSQIVQWKNRLLLQIFNVIYMGNLGVFTSCSMDIWQTIEVGWKVSRLIIPHFYTLLYLYFYTLYNIFIIQIIYISLLQYMLMCFEGNLCCLLFRRLSNFQGLSKFQGHLPGIAVKGPKHLFICIQYSHVTM